MGRRISSTDASDTTYYHYNGWNVVAESIGGTITARYYYDDNQQVMAMKKDDQTYYYQRNAHGDVVSLTDSSGDVVNSYSYDPWGNHLSSTETVANPFRYAGYRYDSDTGLYYLRARYYNSDINRFLTLDPDIGELMIPVTQNRYSYAENNPTTMIDILGFKAINNGIRWVYNYWEQYEQDSWANEKNVALKYAKYGFANFMQFSLNASGLMEAHECGETLVDEKASASQKAWAGAKIPYLMARNARIAYP